MGEVWFLELLAVQHVVWLGGFEWWWPWIVPETLLYHWVVQAVRCPAWVHWGGFLFYALLVTECLVCRIPASIWAAHEVKLLLNLNLPVSSLLASLVRFFLLNQFKNLHWFIREYDSQKLKNFGEQGADDCKNGGVELEQLLKRMERILKCIVLTLIVRGFFGIVILLDISFGPIDLNCILRFPYSDIPGLYLELPHTKSNNPK